MVQRSGTGEPGHMTSVLQQLHRDRLELWLWCKQAVTWQPGETEEPEDSKSDGEEAKTRDCSRKTRNEKRT